MFESATRDQFRRRLAALRPDAVPRWGRLSAPAMVCHLADTLRLTLGDVSSMPVPSPLRLPGVKHLVIGLLPWPRGRIVGPAEAFTTLPAQWAGDLSALDELLERFGRSGDRDAWPPHPVFGAMSRPLWDRFTCRHTHHHLTQFGV